ncbi:MAG: hypothetical protein IT424_06755 [Pirellulales bacterium]|nr:hypothetical protein [Pirellulales bacterium]
MPQNAATEQVGVGEDGEAPPVSNGLQLERRMTFQRLEWRWQRVGWAVWFLTLAAAVAGLLGNGPLSDATATASDGSMAVEYERFLHRQGPSVLSLLIRSGSSDTLQLRIDNQYLRGVKIERIEPEPQQTLAGDALQTLVFARAPEAEFVHVRIHYSPEHMGELAGALSVAGGEEVRFWQFVYP